MMRRVLSVGVALLMVPLLGLAQQTPRPERAERQPRMRMMANLNLTETQQKQFDEMRFDLEKRMVAQRAKIAEARIELRQLFSQDKPDQSAINKKIQEVSRLQTEQKQLLVDHWFSVNKILTPEQQKVWKHTLGARLESRAFNRAGRRGMMPYGTGMMRQGRGTMRQGPGMMRQGPGTVEKPSE